MVNKIPFRFYRIPVGIDNCYLLCGEKAVLIDGGAPNNLNAFVFGLQKLDVEPQEIKLIILTHGHADHIGSLHDIQRLSGAKVAVHRGDQYWVESGYPALPPGITLWGRVLIGLGTYLYHPQIIPCRVDHAFSNEGFSLFDYGIPGRVVHMPGHSPGSACVLLDTGEVFAGDMAMNTWFLRSTPGLPVLAENRNTVVESWKKIIQMGARRVYPAHGLDFPIRYIQKELLKLDAKNWLTCKFQKIKFP